MIRSSVYPYYLDALLLNEDYEEATKLIDFALTIKGIDKVAIMLKKALLLEKQGAYKQGVKYLKEIKLLVTSSSDTSEIEDIEKRFKAKQKLVAPKKKSKVKNNSDAKKKKQK